MTANRVRGHHTNVFFKNKRKNMRSKKGRHLRAALMFLQFTGV
jgi:hypothetical protein